jgi:N-acetylglutamate synthase-like GNAT family acetyltransferase
MGAEPGRPGSAARIGPSGDVELIRALFREYADSFGVDLSFQDFEAELAALPEGYDAVLVAELDGEAVGCVGIRPLAARICELKSVRLHEARASAAR